MSETKKLTKGRIAEIIRVEPPGKYADGDGLHIQKEKDGKCYWRYKFRLGGKAFLAGYGNAADADVDKVREDHRADHDMVRKGVNPILARRQGVKELKVQVAGRRPFSSITAEYLAARYPSTRRAKTTIKQVKSYIKHLDAGFGRKDVSEVCADDLAAVLDKLEKDEKFAMREKVQETAIAIGEYACGKGYLKHAPFSGIKYKAVYTSRLETWEPRPALTDADRFGKLLRDIDRIKVIETDKRTRHANIDRLLLQLLALLALRPGELSRVDWEKGVDFKRKKIIVPFTNQKMRTLRKKKKSPRVGKDFEVPLSRQALALLQQLRQLTGNFKYLFPARPGRGGDAIQLADQHINPGAANAALVRLGYQGEHCGHGFRSTFSTTMNAERILVGNNKVARWPDQKALVEVQLDHEDASTQAIYDRGGDWDERCELMQLWADRIDQMRAARPDLRAVA